MTNLSIDVVVRTQSDAGRARSLARALESIRDQRGVSARPIVVVNGPNVDAPTLAALKKQPGILLHREQRASAALSMAVGRSLVTAPYFAFLDDDDEMIANSLLEPLQWLADHPACEAVITNGYFVKADGRTKELTRFATGTLLQRPALWLMADGWLAPGAFVCRTANVPSRMFSDQWSNMEWTRLAFELCAEKKNLHFMDVPTMRYHDTEQSLSKGTRHLEAQLELLTHVRQDLRLDLETRRAASRKRLRTLHHLAIRYRSEGHYLRAWRYHIGSLCPPYTFKYLLVSRKLVLPIGRARRAEPCPRRSELALASTDKSRKRK